MNQQDLTKILRMNLITSMGLLTGCLGSVPKKADNLHFLKNRVLSQQKLETQTEPSDIKTIESLFPGAAEIPNQIDCHDRESAGNYSEDMSAECVRSQTLRAYQAFGLQIDPEIPYCILRQETSLVKNDSDPYDVAFNRLAVCGGKGKKYCGVGLAQITFRTWGGYNDTLNRDENKKQKLERCLKDLGSYTNKPPTYQFLTFQTINSTTIDEAMYQAKTRPPSDQLSPFYRDHAICLNAFHISELKAAKTPARSQYAVVGKGKKRRKVYLSPSLVQAQKIGDAYNGGGTPGYGSKIGKCVAGFRNYDNIHQASADSFHLKIPRLSASEMAKNDIAPEVQSPLRQNHNF